MGEGEKTGQWVFYSNMHKKRLFIPLEIIMLSSEIIKRKNFHPIMISVGVGGQGGGGGYYTWS